MYQRIRDLRENKDLRQVDIAEYLNCGQVTYAYYELGRRSIPTEVLIKRADFNNTSVDYLLGRTDEKKTYPKRK